MATLTLQSLLDLEISIPFHPDCPRCAHWFDQLSAALQQIIEPHLIHHDQSTGSPLPHPTPSVTEYQHPGSPTPDSLHRKSQSSLGLNTDTSGSHSRVISRCKRRFVAKLKKVLHFVKTPKHLLFNNGKRLPHKFRPHHQQDHLDHDHQVNPPSSSDSTTNPTPETFRYEEEDAASSLSLSTKDTLVPLSRRPSPAHQVLIRRLHHGRMGSKSTLLNHISNSKSTIFGSPDLKVQSPHLEHLSLTLTASNDPVAEISATSPRSLLTHNQTSALPPASPTTLYIRTDGMTTDIAHEYPSASSGGDEEVVWAGGQFDHTANDHDSIRLFQLP